MEDVVPAPRRTLLPVRLTPDLRDRVRAYARTVGISESAAAAVLISRGLDTDLPAKARP